MMWVWTGSNGSIDSYYCTSATVKPTQNIRHGSEVYEIDGNHDLYIFNGDTGSWEQQ